MKILSRSLRQSKVWEGVSVQALPHYSGQSFHLTSCLKGTASLFSESRENSVRGLPSSVLPVGWVQASSLLGFFSHSLDFSGQDTKVQVHPTVSTATTAVTGNSMEKPAPASKPSSNVSCIWSYDWLPEALPITHQSGVLGYGSLPF